MKNLKKIIFIMIFVSVISVIKISKVSAILPNGEYYYGNTWDSLKVRVGQFYNNAGALNRFFYPNYTDTIGVSPNCPYLDNGPLAYPLGPQCFIGEPGDSYTNYPNSTFFESQAERINQGGVMNNGATVHNFSYTLPNWLYMTSGNTYKIIIYFGFDRQYWQTMAPILDNPSFQSNLTLYDYEVRGFLSSDEDNIYSSDYLRVTYTIKALSNLDSIFIDFVSSTSLSFYQTWGNLTWLIQPKVLSDPTANLRKYTFNKGQLVFISGIQSGQVFISQDYGNFNQKDFSYASYYDNDAYPQPYDNYIYNYSFFNLMGDNKSYLVYNFDLVNNLHNAESLLLSLNSWYTFDSESPYQSVDFYVDREAYVDIVTPDSNGIITYTYKNPITGISTPIIIDNGSFLVGQSTLFDSVSSGLVYFTPSVLAIGNIYNSFFTSLSTPLQTFLLFSFSIGAMLLLIKLFM